jgi:non-specific serine/threonine protein kinase
MGLGKTIQVIALLLHVKREGEAPAEPGRSRKTRLGGSLALPDSDSNGRVPSLLVAPASLLANWKSEIERFAPSLSAVIAHPSETDPDKLLNDLNGFDLVMTTYGMLTRLERLRKRRWRLAILDEAQAIKNAGTRQTRAVKELDAAARITLTGTPVENRLSDLWSLFDFLNPGLLGGAKQFASFAKQLAKREENAYGPLRTLVKPYILRRLKTDKSVIADLPDKTEVRAFCTLSKRQAALYMQAVGELADQLQSADGIQRKGIVLASLMRLKQICNHPSQWLANGSYEPAESGKFHRLAEICQELAERQEKALVFTQFREITDPLAHYLETLYGRPGLILHGGTPVKERRKLVDAFQDEQGPPFFVLSLKAGGTGLNLTAASHVIHFDRWWNPAVENQATDRAFRIGQKRNVLVHKFVCRGTVEEKIDRLIAEKVSLANELLGEGGERLLTEMSNQELMRFVALDIHRAVES